MDIRSTQRIYFAISAIVCLMLIAPVQSWGGSSGTVDIRITATRDDAEEKLSSGSVDDGSSDLELGYEGSDAKMVGLRFPNVQLPRGATITRAYIQFYCDEVTTGPASFTIWGHDWLLSEEFDKDDNHNISSRDKTSASVAWSNVPDWNQTHDAHQTPDISAIVQEIVDRVGIGGILWDPGRAMTFMITGTGKRTAESYNGTSAEAPLLHIEYTSDAVEARVSTGDDDVEEDPVGDLTFGSSDLELIRDGNDDQFVGLRFQNVQVPQGALITNAYITFTADETKSGSTTLYISAEAADDAPEFVDTEFNVSNRPRTGQSIVWNNVPIWDQVHALYSTPDLSAVVQEVVGRPGWQSGNAMVFVIFGSGVRTAESYNGYPAGAPLLHIEFGEGANAPYINVDETNLGASCYAGENAGSVGFTLTNSGSADLNYTISADQTWLSLSSAGGSPLEPGAAASYSVNFNTASMPAGTYEATITITDSNASNSPQEIQVSVTIFPTEDIPSCGNVPLYTENLAHPAVLILLDISSSMSTKLEVATNERQQIPNLKDIVQEIIDRAGWNSGQSMAFTLEGKEGDRIAKSFDGDSGAAPLLHVEYNDGIPREINIRVSNASDDAEENKDGNMFLSNNDLTLIKDNKLGLRFRKVTIPKNDPPGTVEIINAYIEFTVDETDTNTAKIKIIGEAFDDSATYADITYNITNRYVTSAKVTWDNIPDWTGTTKERRIDIGKSVISDLVKDRSISWGFGTWTNKEPWKSEPDYTLIHVGTKPHTDDHQQELQAAIAATDKQSGTPFGPSINAAYNYFSGQKRDKEGTGDLYDEIGCQPKFLIDVTDGRGNTGSSVEIVRNNTAALADSGFTPVAVGFGLEYDQAEQLYEMAKVANEKGNQSEFDNIYAIHEELNGVGQPYFAFNKQELLEKLRAITENIKGAIFYGSAPAPTTSADLGHRLIVAKFDASRWIGDIEALTKIDPKRGWTSDNMQVDWSAGALMPTNPADRNVWTINPVSPYNVVRYEDGTLSGDNWLCKPIGDIINSTPVVVGTPPFFYRFDNYQAFRSNLIANNVRPPIIYVGSNDGSLHAFSLDDIDQDSDGTVDVPAGTELWAFVPRSLHDKLKLAASDPDGTYDMCADGYCHQYLLDGSPKVADISSDFNTSGSIEANEWRTILVTGLRQGGQAYFALDVTAGQDFNPANSYPSKHLWEFTDFPYLGETWSEPSINRVVDDSVSPSKTMWAAYFGSGYSPTDQTNKEAYLFGIRAYDAVDLWQDAGNNPIHRIKMTGQTPMTIAKIKNYSEDKPEFFFAVGEKVTGGISGAYGYVVSVQRTAFDTATLTLRDASGTWSDSEEVAGDISGNADLDGTPTTAAGVALKNDALSSPLAVDFEADYISDRIYAGNLYGNMYRVDSIGRTQTPTVSTLFTFDHTDPDTNPVRAKADYAYADNYDPTIWVYWGTGRYENQTDKTNSASQYFLGVKDWRETDFNPLKPEKTYRLSDLVTLRAKFVTPADGPFAGKTYRVVDGVNPGKAPWAVELFAKQSSGWGFSGPMPAGSERVLVKPLVLGGVVFFTTFIPDQNVCAGNGESWLFAVDFETGQIPDYPVWDINGDGLYDENDMIKIGVDGEGKDILVPPNGIFIGRGQASHLVFHDGYLFYTTTGSGDVDNPDGGPGGAAPNPINIGVKLRSWKQN